MNPQPAPPPAMTELPPGAVIVAVVHPCEQFLFRVDLPGTLDRALRAGFRRMALQEINDTFLECTRRYQALAWVGVANLAFIDSQSSPRDSKSKFLHLLICLKTVELSILHHRGLHPADEAPEFAVTVTPRLSRGARMALKKLCKSHGVLLHFEYDLTGQLEALPRIGGEYRAPRSSSKAFAHQPVKAIEDFRSAAARRLAGHRLIKRWIKSALRGVALLFWPLLIVARALFSIAYRLAARRVLRKLDGPRNVFLYFELLSGRNRDTGAYLRWKFGPALAGGAVIPFSHLVHPNHAYSLAAMRWSLQALRKMARQPGEGCVVVNYLIPPWLLVKLHFRRGFQGRRKLRRLQALHKESTDFIARRVYSEFISTLETTKVYAMEVSKAYQLFFAMLAPGVVVQADAVSKTARHFTACAKRRGGRAVYVADRICTSLRTSNKLIGDDGANLHFPDRCVVFDQVTRQEFLDQGFVAGRIYPYCRSFGAVAEVDPARPPRKRRRIVIYLQDYSDNIGAMIRLGIRLARRFPEIHVFYQEHPNFPVGERAKAKILLESPGRLHFMSPGEAMDHSRVLALVTGYSTAAVPGILQGVPLIWLRREVDNSIYGEAYLDRIGFAADKPVEVIHVLKRLRRKDPATLEAAAGATRQACEIFTPVSGPASSSLPEALDRALDDSFAEIEAAAPAPQPAGNPLRPVRI